MKTVDDIVAAAGGADRVVRALAITPDALRKWRQFGRVPAKHYVSLMRLGAGRITLDDLAHDSRSSTEAA